MKIRLIKLGNISGSTAAFYSVYYNNDKSTLFENFIDDNKILLKGELFNILARLNTMANEEGAREIYFKNEEGVPGDRVCALYDTPNKNLRLYCIRFGSRLVVLGSGGMKPKRISALQDDPKLKAENKKLCDIVKLSEKKINEGEISISSNNMEFKGDFELKDDYYDD